MAAPMIPTGLSFSWMFILIFLLSYGFSSLSNKKHVRLSTKTAYNNLIKLIGPHTSGKNRFPRPDICQPIHLSMVLRHGTRYPSGNDIKKMDKMADRIVGNIKSERFLDLNSWKSPFLIKNQKKLVKVGLEEHYGIADRYLQGFPELFTNTKDLKFVSSRMARSKESGHAFKDVIAQHIPDVNELSISENDDTMRYFETCHNYIEQIENNKTSTHIQEVEKFKCSPEMQNAINKVSERLEIKRNIQLTAGDMMAIFRVCAYEVAFYGQSRWCDVLQDEEWEVMEYISDLKQYWMKAYGFTLNYDQACPLMTDIVTNMDYAAGIGTGDAYKGIFRFGHAETIQPIIAMLGLFKDKLPLYASNFQQQRQREFRCSLISPFAANIAFVLYRCDTDQINTDQSEWPEKMEDLMLQVYVNERPVRLPFCQHNICSYKMFKEQYSKHFIGCDYEDICGKKLGPKDEL